jgi:hypothetical protein
MSRRVLRPSHADEGEDEVGGSDGDGLEVSGELAEACGGKDVVEVVEDGVDAGELVEGADGDGEEEWEAVLPLEDGFVGDGVNFLEGELDVGNFLLGVRVAHELEDFEGLFDAEFGDGPAGAAGDAEEEDEEEQSGDGGDAELDAPLGGSEVEQADDEVRGVGEEDADDDIDLEGADHASAPLGGGQLRNVDGTEDGAGTDAESAEEAEGE